MAAKKQGAAGEGKTGTAEQEVDAQLARYRAMRDFAATAEPSGSSTKAAAPGALPFVIQKHAATRLHYDFRLGWRGVLKSWAVAKGPSYNTADKRLAVQVEDHPMEYGGFEGAIPKGQYGGGTVMVWDQGTWEPVGDVDEGLAKGSLKFALHGEKLNGRWTLVRMGGHAAQEAKPNWLLIKEHDGNERTSAAVAVTEELPDSVVTRRSLEQIAEAEDHVWNSRPAEHGAATETPAKRSRSRLQEKLGKSRRGKPSVAASDVRDRAPATEEKSTAAAWLESAPAVAFPGFIAPQLAVAAVSIPSGSNWLNELKLDGYRVQAHVRTRAKGKREVMLFTRSGLDWTHRMKRVAEALEKLECDEAILDGEVVVLDEKGTSSFSRLQAAFEQGEAATLTYFAFDLLYLNKRDLRGLPLRARKALLEPLVNGATDPLLVFSQHLEMTTDAVFAHACELGAEGILSKNGDARYTSGRSDAWLKLKCTHRQEFVIAGFTLPKDKGAGVGSLLLGYYEAGRLVHCGRCGTGFTQASARAVRRQMEPLREAKAAYSGTLSREAKKDAIWLKPELVCEVQFATWTADGSIRHASFQGMRADKAAAHVVKEEPKQPKPDDAPDESAEQAESVTEAVADSAASGKKLADAKAPWKKRAVAGAAPEKTARITHPDKVLDASTGTTKQQLADYYEAVASAMLPHLANRPVSIVRCPEGSEKKCFFQKHAKTGMPSSVAWIDVPEREDRSKTEPYIAIDSSDALLGLAQLGVLELHPWGSQADALERPDRLIFDLDPDESLPWKTVVESARSIRAFLQELKLESFVKSTGGKGLHVVVAIEPQAEWPEIKLFARGIAVAIESTDPKLYLIKMTKAARKGRIFVDWMRNERGATAIAPWSPRARAGMRVAVPLGWDELGDSPARFAVANFDEWRGRIGRRGNPWAGMKAQPLLPEVLQAVLEQSGGMPVAKKQMR
jgi:bifunctional non-homologous end joining protein LigD